MMARTGADTGPSGLPLTHPLSPSPLGLTFPRPLLLGALSPSFPLATSILAQSPAPRPAPAVSSCWLRSCGFLLSEQVQRCCLGTNHGRPNPPVLPFPLQALRKQGCAGGQGEDRAFSCRG